MGNFNFNNIGLLGLAWYDLTGDTVKDIALLRKAYLRASKTLHPDNGIKDDSHFKKMKQCYDSIMFVLTHGSIVRDRSLDINKSVRVSVQDIINGYETELESEHGNIKVSIKPGQHEVTGIYTVYKFCGKRVLKSDGTLHIGNMNLTVTFSEPLINIELDWYAFFTGGTIYISPDLTYNISKKTDKDIAVNIPRFIKPGSVLDTDYVMSDGIRLAVKCDIKMPRSGKEFDDFIKAYNKLI